MHMTGFRKIRFSISKWDNSWSERHGHRHGQGDSLICSVATSGRWHLNKDVKYVKTLSHIITWRTNFASRANKLPSFKAEMCLVSFQGSDERSVWLQQTVSRKLVQVKMIGEGWWWGRELGRVLEAYHCKLTGFHINVTENPRRVSSRTTQSNLCSKRMTPASLWRTHSMNKR